jgi:hypothetical protein
LTSIRLPGILQSAGDNEVPTLGIVGWTEQPVSNAEYSEWQKAYWEALLEVNPEKLAVRIFEAETAILKRMRVLQTSSDGHKEREAIEGALSGLRVLQRRRLDYPPWEQSYC